MASRLKSRLLLEGGVLGGPSGTRKQVVLYTGVVAGALAQVGLQGLQNNADIGAAEVFLAFVASIVTFPVIFENAGLKRTDVSFTKWCVAFQNGFFWPTLLGQVTSAFHTTT